MLRPLVPKFRPDLSVRLKDITENQVPAKLKPMVSSGGVAVLSVVVKVMVGFMVCAECPGCCYTAGIIYETFWLCLMDRKQRRYS